MSHTSPSLFSAFVGVEGRNSKQYNLTKWYVEQEKENKPMRKAI